MSDGQIVTVDGRYGFRWTGREPLAVGDRVVLPANRWTASTWIGTVTALGAEWTGPMKVIVGRAP